MQRLSDIQNQLFRHLSSEASGQEDTVGTFSSESSEDVTAYNEIVGTAGADTLNGTSGFDIILGLGGNDFISAGDGFDRLDGGLGQDTMNGGAGSDYYFVDSFNDKVTDVLGTLDTDIIMTTVSYTIAENSGIEAMQISDPISKQAITLTGSNSNGASGDEFLVGNDGVNTLSGRGGNDNLDGRAGGDVILGGDGDDILYGSLGNDLLIGGAGVDILSGEDDMDTFEFDISIANFGLDKVSFFVTAQDTINLRTGAGGGHFLGANQFFTGTAAHDADDRVIYNASTGKVFYDPDGTGSALATAFAILTNKPTGVSAADFFVFGF